MQKRIGSVIQSSLPFLFPDVLHSAIASGGVLLNAVIFSGNGHILQSLLEAVY